MEIVGFFYEQLVVGSRSRSVLFRDEFVSFVMLNCCGIVVLYLLALSFKTWYVFVGSFHLVRWFDLPACETV